MISAKLRLMPYLYAQVSLVSLDSDLQLIVVDSLSKHMRPVCR